MPGVYLEMFGDPPPPDMELKRSLALEGADVVGFIGSFFDYEGFDDLITAMPLLVGEQPSAHLLLVVRVPHEKVERYYGLTDILAYPRKAMRLPNW